MRCSPIIISPVTARFGTELSLSASLSVFAELYQPQEARGRGWNTASRSQESRRKAQLGKRKKVSSTRTAGSGVAESERSDEE